MVVYDQVMCFLCFVYQVDDYLVFKIEIQVDFCVVVVNVWRYCVLDVVGFEFCVIYDELVVFYVVDVDVF